jgi:hypothetical protein
MIVRCWKKPSNVLNGWWKKKASLGNIKSGNIMKSPRPFLTGKKRRFSGNCSKNPEKADPITKSLWDFDFVYIRYTIEVPYGLKNIHYY